MPTGAKVGVNAHWSDGWPGRSRSCDRPLNRRMLCQLSYGPSCTPCLPRLGQGARCLSSRCQRGTCLQSPGYRRSAGNSQAVVGGKSGIGGERRKFARHRPLTPLPPSALTIRDISPAVPGLAGTPSARAAGGGVGGVRAVFGGGVGVCAVPLHNGAYPTPGELCKWHTICHYCGCVCVCAARSWCCFALILGGWGWVRGGAVGGRHGACVWVWWCPALVPCPWCGRGGGGGGAWPS
jgi:hypothetical protein